MKPPREQMSKNLPSHPTRIATLEIEQQTESHHSGGFFYFCCFGFG
jgi:hypothetical protein